FSTYKETIGLLILAKQKPPKGGFINVAMWKCGNGASRRHKGTGHWALHAPESTCDLGELRPAS
ncbi:MAG: hypothetical protein ACK458_08360, partial [Sphingobacteriales bacterium]